MNLDPAYSIYAFGPPARAEGLTLFTTRYGAVPVGYTDLVREMTGIVLLWNRRSELRLWGPHEALGMDDAYGISQAMPGAVPIGDNGGGQVLIYGFGGKGPGLYLVETGALFFEDADWIAADLQALLEQGEGAEKIFLSDPLPDDVLNGAPFFDQREDRDV